MIQSRIKPPVMTRTSSKVHLDFWLNFFCLFTKLIQTFPSLIFLILLEIISCLLGAILLLTNKQNRNHTYSNIIKYEGLLSVLMNNKFDDLGDMDPIT